MPLSSEEIQIRRALIPKLKEETLSHDEAEELVTLLDKEKSIALEEGGDCMLSLISYVNEYSDNHSELNKKKSNSFTNRTISAASLILLKSIIDSALDF